MNTTPKIRKNIEFEIETYNKLKRMREILNLNYDKATITHALEFLEDQHG